MAKIAVAAGGNKVYHVTVEEGTSRTTHEVTVTPDDVQCYASGVAGGAARRSLVQIPA